MSCVQGIQGSRGPTGQQGPAGQSFIITFPSISDGVSFITSTGNNLTGVVGHPELPFITPPTSNVSQLTSDMSVPSTDRDYFTTARQTLQLSQPISGNNTYRGLVITGSQLNFSSGDVIVESCILLLNSSDQDIIPQSGTLLIMNSVIIINSSTVGATIFNTSGSLHVQNTTIVITGQFVIGLISAVAINGTFIGCIFRVTNATLMDINGVDVFTTSVSFLDSNNLVIIDANSTVSEGPNIAAPGSSITTNRYITGPGNVLQLQGVSNIVYNSVTVANGAQSYYGIVMNSSGTLMRPRMQLRMVVKPVVVSYTIGRYDYALVIGFPVVIPADQQIHGRTLEISSTDPNVIVQAGNIIDLGGFGTPVLAVPPGFTYIFQYDINTNSWYVISKLQ